MIREYIDAASYHDSPYDVERWQNRVGVFLESALGDDARTDFDDLVGSENPFDDQASQVGFLEALALRVDLPETVKRLTVGGVLDPEASPTFWNHYDARLFISHVSKLGRQASRLRDELLRYGVTSFVAHVDIEPTREWQQEIESALSTMDALAALLSTGFNESRWCDQEVGVAIGRQIPIVPVKVGLDPYGFFGKYQALPAKGRVPKEVAVSIFETLIKKQDISSKIADNIIVALARSHGWTESKRLVSLLERFPFLASIHVERLKATVDETTAVSDATGLPARIEILANRFGG